MSILVLTSDTLIGTPATGNIEYNGQFFGTDSDASRAQMQRITQGTAVASTSGTNIDFTGLPAWVKRLTVMFNSVSTSGTSNLIIQLGDSGGIETTGYVNAIGNTTSASANAGASYTNGCNVPDFAAASSISGQVIFSNLSGNNWVFSGLVADPSTPRIVYSAGVKSLSSTLDRVRITTANGTDTFDVGSVNLLWEG